MWILKLLYLKNSQICPLSILTTSRKSNITFEVCNQIKHYRFLKQHQMEYCLKMLILFWNETVKLNSSFFLDYIHCSMNPGIIVCPCRELSIPSMEDVLNTYDSPARLPCAIWWPMFTLHVDEFRRVCPLNFWVMICVLMAKLCSSANLLGSGSIDDLMYTLSFHSAGAQWVCLLEERIWACSVSSDSLIGSLRQFLKFLGPLEELSSCVLPLPCKYWDVLCSNGDL